MDIINHSRDFGEGSELGGTSGVLRSPGEPGWKFQVQEAGKALASSLPLCLGFGSIQLTGYIHHCCTPNNAQGPVG